MFDQTISVPENIVDCFKYCSIDQNLVCLPSRSVHSYEEKTFSSFKAFLGKYKAKWLSAKQAFQLPFLARPFVDMVLTENEAPKPNPLAYFPTPKPIIDCMLTFAGIHSMGSLDGLRILEPNGGGGAILDALSPYMSDDVTLHTCELDPINRVSLEEKGYQVVAHDFLEYHPGHKYDLVIANPPYAVKSDPHAYITHLKHALSLLSPFGKLVAVIPTAFEDGDNKIKSEFREFCYENAEFDFEHFPKGSFEDTSIETTVIVLGGSKLADPMFPEVLQSDYKHVFEERAHLVLCNDSKLMLQKIPAISDQHDDAEVDAIVNELFALSKESHTRLPVRYFDDYRNLVLYELERYKSDNSVTVDVSEDVETSNHESALKDTSVDTGQFFTQVEMLMGEISKALDGGKATEKPSRSKKAKVATPPPAFDQFELAF